MAGSKMMLVLVWRPTARSASARSCSGISTLKATWLNTSGAMSMPTVMRTAQRSSVRRLPDMASPVLYMMGHVTVDAWRFENLTREAPSALTAQMELVAVGVNLEIV